LDIIKDDPIDNRRNFFRFYNHLVTILHRTRESGTIIAAARVIGKLTFLCGNTLGDRFVEEQIPNFLEMTLAEEASIGAVLVLKELARHSSVHFLPHLAATFRTISVLLRNLQVRFHLIVIVRTKSISFLTALCQNCGCRVYGTSFCRNGFDFTNI
jgi:FKBP12-rapamycin complex-associated protein